MNSTRIDEVRVANPKEPLSYDEACRRYAEWSERESAEQGVILLGIPQPNRGLSEVVGSTWHLENVRGPLAKVGATGRVWGRERLATEMKALQELLAALPPGPVPDDIELDHSLAECWDRLKGNADGGMEGYKLLRRMENVVWKSPILQFTIERHGGTVNGSTRAELQHWEINLDNRTACIVKEGHRQLQTMAPRVSVKAIAEEIAGLILSGSDDERILRLDDGSVKVRASKVFADGSGFKQTVEGRRKRLVECVRDQLVERGWIAVAGNVFRHTT